MRCQPVAKWRALTATLLSTLVVPALAVPALAVPAPAAEPQTIQVDLAQRTGPVLHGAGGALYAMSDDGVPSDNTLAPLKIKEIAQKPPDGLQHPNGDADKVADAFFRTGGERIQVYLQDVYTTWPYENLGIDDFLSKVDTIVPKLVANPYRDRFVYVPFNEPDFIWYDLRSADPAKYAAERDRFFAHWEAVYRKIRSIDPKARIVGPSETGFDSRLLPEFLSWTKQHDVLPDIVSWHELSPDFMTGWRSHLEAYRSFERQAGVGPLQISINEYANRRDLTVPGQLVQWVSRFENSKVYAEQPYWDVASNLSGNVVQTNQPNGGWWFYKMYADMTGDTVAVTPPNPDGLDSLQGMAAIDDTKRQAHIVVGGTTGDTNVVISGIPAGHSARPSGSPRRPPRGVATTRTRRRLRCCATRTYRCPGGRSPSRCGTWTRWRRTRSSSRRQAARSSARPSPGAPPTRRNRHRSSTPPSSPRGRCPTPTATPRQAPRTSAASTSRTAR